MSINQVSLVQLTGVGKKKRKAQITENQPRSQGSLLPVPTEQERRPLGEKTWVVDKAPVTPFLCGFN